MKIPDSRAACAASGNAFGEVGAMKKMPRRLARETSMSPRTTYRENVVALCEVETIML